jgi:polysaccharide pyruvyl transferase WcaK-like protein
MGMNKKKIIIFGAFDRYNYGDILLPLILTHYVDAKLHPQLCYASIKDVNLSKMGGFKCESFQKVKINSDDTIIISGGEVLTVDWTSIVSYYVHPFINRLIRITRQIMPRKLINFLCAKWMGSNIVLPFIIEHHSNTIYNTVGGAQLKDSQQFIQTQLRDAYLISVRDSHAKKIINENWDIPCSIIPDMAISTSKFYPLPSLEDKIINGETRKFIQSQQKNYFCFQMGKQYTNGQQNIIVDELKKILSMGYSIALLPLGIASGHEDHIILESIFKQLNSQKVFFPQQIHVVDSIALIAHASVFAGTSLHGNITAMSYAIPHFSLNSKVEKLKLFLQKWDVGNPQICNNYSEIVEKFKIVINNDSQALNENAERLISIVDGFATQINERINENTERII